MAEKEYIEREAVINFANNHITKSLTINDIARFPAADVVEVVRCKDCMHYDFIENYCDLLGCDLPGDLFYCHDGAKMDGGEEK